MLKINHPEAEKQLVAALKEAEGFGRSSMAVLAVEDGWHWPGSGRCLQCWWRKGSFWAYRSLEHYPARWNRFAPPKAGFFCAVASLRIFADAPHCQATRA